MPRTSRPDPLYQRGPFKLYRRADRDALEIVWYDEARKRERSRSAATADVDAAKEALDRLYLEGQGRKICPTCGQHVAQEIQTVTVAMADYLVLAVAKPSYNAIANRLGHVAAFVKHENPNMLCSAVDEPMITKFRTWMAKQGDYALSTVEASVAQLAAAIRATQPVAPQFKPLPLLDLNQSPKYRADVKKLAAMFKYALTDTRNDKQRENGRQMPRENLLRFIRASVATLARPDAVYDISTDPARRQWDSTSRTLDLNPAGRKQTKKYRAFIPIARQFASCLDASTGGRYVPVASIRKAWEGMAAELKLPGDREAGMKLIRRSMASLVRDRLGETNYPQVSRFMGHSRARVTDIYALAKPEQLGLALDEIEKIIDEIEALAPGAYRNTARLRVVA